MIDGLCGENAHAALEAAYYGGRVLSAGYSICRWQRSTSTARDIKRKTRRKYNAEENIRIVIEGLQGEETIAELCWREGIAHKPV